ncbi:DUF7694 domain-containing protein [Bradyrhizobium sp. CCBAU 45384]|uniref:DUF7694 domain-containing protein n=1 Tax=Bradyrhizobium sp. CCBAU 45384 TaxID=858428 RepID=UPI003FA4D3A9
MIDKLEAGRVQRGPFATAPGSGPCGLFFVRGPCGCELKITALVHPGWEHVAVSTPRRCPNWEEMCFVKDTCFGMKRRASCNCIRHNRGM